MKHSTIFVAAGETSEVPITSKSSHVMSGSSKFTVTVGDFAAVVEVGSTIRLDHNAYNKGVSVSSTQNCIVNLSWGGS